MSGVNAEKNTLMNTEAETISPKELADILGITSRAINKRSNIEGWSAITLNRRGDRRFIITGLPSDIQKKMISRSDIVTPAIIPSLSPEAALTASMKLAEIETPTLSCACGPGSWADDTAVGYDVIRDPRVKRIAKIVQEAMDVPRGWKKSKWIDAVAVKNGTTRQTIYKWIKKYQKKGLTGFKHTKGNKGKPRVWTPEAIDFWIGLCLKREHRKIAKNALYEILAAEAYKRCWRIGSYDSAMDYLNKKATPQLLALQRGGVRALDNMLPPIYRDYSDLAPFEILVGDQHRFDFWVVDDETGEVFRPEGYFWQDLRTRCFYGGAVDKKYDAYLIGLALRIGLRLFGAFGSIYTDHGRPELSRYIMGILSDMRTLGLGVERTIDAALDTSDIANDLVNPCVTMPGTHRKAIVRNAKAKMIEGTFNIMEGILRDHLHVPGYVKRLTDSGENQDVDQKEVERLAAAGKLLTFSEFVLRVFQAMDYYNRKKHHRGVLREWTWKPKPRLTAPMDCLKMCFLEGWQPRRLEAGVVDTIFLARVTGGRVVDRGRISFRNRLYEHDDLIGLHKQRVDVRFDPMDLEGVLVFGGDDFICRAEPIEYSSMKDQDLASRKIEEKRRHRKAVLDEFRSYTKKIPDFLSYSEIPNTEKMPAITGKAKQEKLKDRESQRPLPQEELDRQVAMLENYQYSDRPVFSTEIERYEWCVTQLAEGATLSAEDTGFTKEYEAHMEPETREYWQIFKENMGIQLSKCEAERI